MDTNRHLQRLQSNGQAFKWKATYKSRNIHPTEDGSSSGIFFKIRVLFESLAVAAGCKPKAPGFQNFPMEIARSVSTLSLSACPEYETYEPAQRTSRPSSLQNRRLGVEKRFSRSEKTASLSP